MRTGASRRQENSPQNTDGTQKMGRSATLISGRATDRRPRYSGIKRLRVFSVRELGLATQNYRLTSFIHLSSDSSVCKYWVIFITRGVYRSLGV